MFCNSALPSYNERIYRYYDIDHDKRSCLYFWQDEIKIKQYYRFHPYLYLLPCHFFFPRTVRPMQHVIANFKYLNSRHMDPESACLIRKGISSFFVFLFFVIRRGIYTANQSQSYINLHIQNSNLLVRLCIIMMHFTQMF